MTDYEFQVGDKVRVKDDVEDTEFCGQVGTVSRVINRDSVPIETSLLVQFKDDDSSYSADELTLLPSSDTVSNETRARVLREEAGVAGASVRPSVSFEVRRWLDMRANELDPPKAGIPTPVYIRAVRQYADHVERMGWTEDARTARQHANDIEPLHV